MLMPKVAWNSLESLISRAAVSFGSFVHFALCAELFVFRPFCGKSLHASVINSRPAKVPSLNQSQYLSMNMGLEFIDFFDVSENKSVKRDEFLCVFFNIRAIHFGISEPSSTDHCLSFFRRFSGCRGAQSLINFENCSNFLEALKLLTEKKIIGH